MISRFHRSGRAAARAIAILGAALILVSTSVGVGHFHESAVSRNGVATAQLGADPGFCLVCQLALHSPGSMVQTTTVARDAVVAETIFVTGPLRSDALVPP